MTASDGAQVPESKIEHVIGERFIICRLKSGEMRIVRLQIGLPLPLDEGRSWECEVALAGLYPGMPKVPGVDSLQCINLAIGLIRQALERFMEGGGQIYWRDGSGPLGVMDLFS
ncbi:MAG: DUF6968 family protein [Moraxellaceae bacterium]